MEPEKEENSVDWDLKKLTYPSKTDKVRNSLFNRAEVLDKMKKVFSEKTFAFGLIFVVFIVIVVFYQQGKISFLPGGKSSPAKIKPQKVEILFKEKEYKLSYKDRPASTVVEISHFEEDENWQGDGEVDFTNFYEGESSFRLVSRDNQEATLTLDKAFDLKEVLNFKFFINLETDPGSIETLSLIFGNRDLSTSYQYSIRELKKGWNLIVLPKEYFVPSTRRVAIPEEESPEEVSPEKTTPGWSNIQKVAIEFVSRPKRVGAANFDFFWGEAEDNYQEDWNTASDKFLSLGKNGEKINLLVINLAGSTAALKRISSAKDYTLQARFTSLRKGRFGFFLRSNFTTGDGYYLMMDGLGLNTWQIYKTGIFEEKRETIVLAKGEISNFQVEEGKSYSLKGEVKGSRIIFYLSVDSQGLTKLGEVEDSSFSSGGVGIAAAGGSIFLIDDIAFFQ